MTEGMLQMLIPIVAILATFGFPVMLVYVWKFFKLKEKELQIDVELRRTSGQALEARVQRLESIILALDADLRAKLSSASPSRSDLFEAPATPENDQSAPALPEASKIR